MEIRRAEWRDLPQVLSLCRRFFDSTEWAKDTTFDDKTMTRTLHGLLGDPRAELLVAADKDLVLAMVGVHAAPQYFGLDLVATELFWYVAEEHRGHKVSGPLFLAAEDWARSIGARCMLMGSLVTSPPHVRTMYERAGYRESQTAFIKRLT